MAKFNLENYETVEDRLKVFWKENPEGRIFTEVVHETEDGSCVTIRAFVYKNEGDSNPISTGIAQETKGQGGFANTDAWVENCETSAIGRALANWKYQGSNKPRPSQQEMSKVVKSTPKVEEELTFDVGEPVNNAQEINEIIKGMEPDDKLMKKYKKTAYDKMIADGFSKDVNDWSEEQVKDFIEAFADTKNNSSIIDEIEAELGEVKVITKNCPECGKSEYIEDNREKKQSDPQKFGKIPSWSCSKYNGANGCGWAGWDDTDCPTEWL
jgi:hypothetical protein